ncbi:MAG: kinase-like domain-containing protein [Piptocephalis tieghemiana]|nr:MAG: kinase-like domain-containing protein [Piptocephalis tieghemiana]
MDRSQATEEPSLNPVAARVGELRATDVEQLKKLGEGAGGTVMKCLHRPTGILMAQKSIPSDPNPQVQKQIMRELSALRRCHSPYIVSYYGAYLDDEDDIAICMEHCDGGSLDGIYKRIRDRQARIGEGVLGKIAQAVLEGLVYLHQQRIIHRDVKPSNILVNAQGQIKLCDFGVSGELVDSVARTFLGTSYYMAPERIMGGGYNVRSDIWSLGLTMVEVAENRFPFPPPGHPPMAPVELLDYVVSNPAPQLVDREGWSQELQDFVRVCLIKDPARRPTPAQSLTHPFLEHWSSREVDLAKWIRQVWA